MGNIIWSTCLWEPSYGLLTYGGHHMVYLPMGAIIWSTYLPMGAIIWSTCQWEPSYGLLANGNHHMVYLPMGTIMAVAAVLEIHMERNMVQIMNPERKAVLIGSYFKD